MIFWGGFILRVSEGICCFGHVDKSSLGLLKTWKLPRVAESLSFLGFRVGLRQQYDTHEEAATLGLCWSNLSLAIRYVSLARLFSAAKALNGSDFHVGVTWGSTVDHQFLISVKESCKTDFIFRISDIYIP